MAVNLTMRELQFLQNNLIKGLEFAACWNEYRPTSKQNPGLASRSGWRIMQKIIEKAGGWNEAYEMVGMGPNAAAKILSDGANATKLVWKGKRQIAAPDYQTRLRVAHEIIEIFSMAEQKVTVHIDKPLPLIIVRSGDDIPTD